MAFVTIKFGGRFPDGMLLTDGGADNAFGCPGHQVWRGGFLRGCYRPKAAQTTLLAALVIKFGGRFPPGILLADGGAAYNAFGCPGHQVWRRVPCWDAVG